MKNNPLIMLGAMLLMMVVASPVFANPTQIYLVRHAEKVTTVSNGDLTEKGQQRAKQLAHLLKSAGITQVYSTEYKRTLQTATPLAKALNLPVKSYNPRELKAFAKQLKQQVGVIVVVGHSNTTPQLVRMLGGQAKDMTEAEYTRLYQLSFVGVNSGEKVNTILLHTTAR